MLDRTRSTNDLNQGITFLNVRAKNNIYQQPKEDRQLLKKFLRTPSQQLESGSESARLHRKSSQEHSLDPFSPFFKVPENNKVPRSHKSPINAPLANYNFETHSLHKHLPEISPRSTFMRNQNILTQPMIHKLKGSISSRDKIGSFASPSSFRETRDVETDRNNIQPGTLDHMDRTASKTYTFTDLKERTVSDLKLDSYRISEFAVEYKDIPTSQNRAYELTMPKDSARRKNMLKTFHHSTHDISHLADLKTQANNSKGIHKFCDELRKDIPILDINNDMHTEDSKGSTTKNSESPQKQVAKYFEMSAFDSALRKASNFLALSNSPLRRTDTHFALREEIKNAVVPLNRRSAAKRFNSDDMTATPNSVNRHTNSYGGKARDAKPTSNFADYASILAPTDDGLEQHNKELVQSLKKELPNLLTDTPSGRTEVLILSNWLKNNINGIKSHSTLTLKEKLYRADEIYNLSLNELIRQVSCECIERGDLIMRIWKSYLALYDDIISDLKSNFANKANIYEEDYARIQEAHKAEINNKNRQIISLKNVELEQVASLDILKSEFDALQTKHTALEDALSRSRNQIRTVKKQYMVIKKEYEDMSYKYNKLRGESHGEDDKLDPEDFLRSKVVINGTTKSIQDTGSRSDLENDEFEPLQEHQQAQQAMNFGNFQGRKVEWADKETEIDSEFAGRTFEDTEAQTNMELLDPKFDIIFDKMQTVEDFVKEEQLKREIHTERAENLEEDLHEAIYNHQQHNLHLITSEESILSDEDDKEGESRDLASGFSNVASIDLGLDTPQRKLNLHESSYSNFGELAATQYSTMNDLGKKKPEDDSLDIKVTRSVTLTPRKSGRNSVEQSLERSTAKEMKAKDRKKLSLTINVIKTKSPLRSHEKSSKITKHNTSHVSRSGEKKSQFTGNNKNRIHVTPKTQEKKLRNELAAPIEENMDENMTTPRGSPTIKKGAFKFDPAMDLKERIRIKVEQSKKRHQKKDELEFISNGGRIDLKKLLDESLNKTPSLLSEDDSPKAGENGLDEQKKSKNMHQFFNNVILKVKYIRLMKMYSFQKNKATELESTHKNLANMVSEDGQLLDQLKDVISDIKSGSNDNIDKGNLIRVIKRIETRKKTVDLMKDKDYAKLVETLSVAENRGSSQLKIPSRAEIRSITSSKVFDDELSDRKKDGSRQRFGNKRSEHKNQMFKANYNTNVNPVQITATTSGVAPVLGKKRDPSNVKKLNPMVDILAKLNKALRKSNKTREVVSLKMVLRTITSFYLDKIAAGRDNMLIREQDMATFVYSSFLNTYGLPKFAETKFIKFMVSVCKYTAIHRIAIFAKLCAIVDPHWLPDEGKQFLIGLEYLLTQQNIGMTIPNPETEKRHYVPLVRAVEYARIYCEKRNLLSELVDIKRDIEQNKDADTTGQNRAGKIRVDFFLEKMVDIYNKYKEKSRIWLENAFDACNMTPKAALSSDELVFLIRNLEPEKYDVRRVEELYNTYEEVVDNDNIGIPIDKFVVLALENDMFSLEKQKRFVSVADVSEKMKMLESLKENWTVKKERLNQLIEYNRTLHEAETIAFWSKAVTKLDEDIKSTKERNPLVVLIRYRLLIIEMNTTFASNIPFS